jgi:hypothetical protein
MAKEIYQGPEAVTLSYAVEMRVGDDNENAASGIANVFGYNATTSTQYKYNGSKRDDPMQFRGTLNIANYQQNFGASQYGAGCLGVFFFDASNVSPSNLRCPKGCTPVVTDFGLWVIGASWTTLTDIRLSDSSFTLDYLKVAASALTQNNVIQLPNNGTLSSAASGVTMLPPLAPVNGGTMENGLVLRYTGTAPTAGGQICAYVEGYWRPSEA